MRGAGHIVAGPFVLGGRGAWRGWCCGGRVQSAVLPKMQVRVTRVRKRGKQNGRGGCAARTGGTGRRRAGIG